MAEKTISAIQYVRDNNDFVPLFPITSADQVYHNIDRVVDGVHNPETITEYIDSCLDGALNLKGSIDDYAYTHHIDVVNKGDAYIIRDPDTYKYEWIAIWYSNDKSDHIMMRISFLVDNDRYYSKFDPSNTNLEEMTYPKSNVDTFIAEIKYNNATKKEINELL